MITSTSRRDVLDVLVVGAGVVGATAALVLARSGLRVALVEAQEPAAWTAETPDLRVYAMASDACALLEEAGAWTPLLTARAQAIRRMSIWDAANRGELSFDADAMGLHDLGRIVEHAVLVDQLWRAVCDETAVSRYCPDSISALEPGEHSTTVVLESGVRLRARLVLGADGAGSAVRRLVGVPVVEHDYQQRGIVAYVDTARPHQATCYQRFLPTGPLAFLPCIGGRSSIVWTVPSAEAERLLSETDDCFAAELTRAFDARLGEVTGISRRQAFPLRQQLAPRMLEGRVALIGDAAHVVHPLAGQGVNLGLRDVAGLLSLVRRAQESGQDFAAPHRLQRWARTRVSENAMAAHAFGAINRLFSNNIVLPTLLRGPLLGMAGRLPPVTRMLWQRASGL